MMRFFSQQYGGGGQTEEETDAIRAAYWRHVDSLAPSLPATVYVLARGLNLHDGLIRGVCVNQAGPTISLNLRCGDLQVGYFDLDLTYLGVDFQASDIGDLAAIANDTKTECLYDEIDRGDGPIWVHRILFWPHREIAVCFQALELHVSPQSGREFVRPREAYVDAGAVSGSDQ